MTNQADTENIYSDLEMYISADDYMMDHGEDGLNRLIDDIRDTLHADYLVVDLPSAVVSLVLDPDDDALSLVRHVVSSGHIGMSVMYRVIPRGVTLPQWVLDTVYPWSEYQLDRDEDCDDATQDVMQVAIRRAIDATSGCRCKADGASCCQRQSDPGSKYVDVVGQYIDDLCD